MSARYSIRRTWSRPAWQWSIERDGVVVLCCESEREAQRQRRRMRGAR